MLPCAVTKGVPPCHGLRPAKVQERSARLARFHASRMSVADCCRAESVSPASFYRWKDQFANEPLASGTGVNSTRRIGTGAKAAVPRATCPRLGSDVAARVSCPKTHDQPNATSFGWRAFGRVFHAGEQCAMIWTCDTILRTSFRRCWTAARTTNRSCPGTGRPNIRSTFASIGFGNGSSVRNGRDHVERLVGPIAQGGCWRGNESFRSLRPPIDWLIPVFCSSRLCIVDTDICLSAAPRAGRVALWDGLAHDRGGCASSTVVRCTTFAQRGSCGTLAEDSRRIEPRLAPRG